MVGKTLNVFLRFECLLLCIVILAMTSGCTFLPSDWNEGDERVDGVQGWLTYYGSDSNVHNELTDKQLIQLLDALDDATPFDNKKFDISSFKKSQLNDLNRPVVRLNYESGDFAEVRISSVLLDDEWTYVFEKQSWSVVDPNGGHAMQVDSRYWCTSDALSAWYEMIEKQYG